MYLMKQGCCPLHSHLNSLGKGMDICSFAICCTCGCTPSFPSIYHLFSLCPVLSRSPLHPPLCCLVVLLFHNQRQKLSRVMCYIIIEFFQFYLSLFSPPSLPRALIRNEMNRAAECVGHIVKCLKFTENFMRQDCHNYLKSFPDIPPFM